MLIPITSGLASAVVSFATGNVEDAEVDPGFSTVTVTFASDGSYSGDGNVSGFSGNWVTPLTAAGSDYEVRMTVNSGSTPGGSATGSWLSLGTTRFWTFSQVGVGFTTSNVTVEIRKASSGVVLSDGGGAFNMSATVSI